MKLHFYAQSTLLAIICMLGGIAWGLSVPPPTSVNLFYSEQIVRVYSDNGLHLFTGEVKYSAESYVTICKIIPRSIGGAFKSDQCAVVDTRSSLLVITAHEPNVAGWR